MVGVRCGLSEVSTRSGHACDKDAEVVCTAFAHADAR